MVAQESQNNKTYLKTYKLTRRVKSGEIELNKASTINVDL